MTDHAKEMQQTLDRLGSLYLAARIILNEQNRANRQELDTALQYSRQCGASLISLGYEPEKSFFKPLPEDPMQRSMKIISGQDGCIPNVDGINVWVVPGERIQNALSNLYSSWFHNLKKR